MLAYIYFKMPKAKHLSEGNTRGYATAERGAHFHPTVGSVTPNGFTTIHPQARPRCFEIQSPTSSSTEIKDEGYSPSPDAEK